jgi:hypothetical protein
MAVLVKEEELRELTTLTSLLRLYCLQAVSASTARAPPGCQYYLSTEELVQTLRFNRRGALLSVHCAVCTRSHVTTAVPS